MKKKSSTAIGREFEQHIERLLDWDNAKRSPTSGATWFNNRDITSDHFVIEAEATEKKSYSVKLSFWDEVRNKAFNNKKPLMAFRFRDEENPRKSVDLIAMDINDFVELMEKVYDK